MNSKKTISLVVIIVFSFCQALAQSGWRMAKHEFTANLIDVAFVDENTAIAVGENRHGFGTILRTSDGGKTWEQVGVGVTSSFLSNVDFIDQNIGYVVGFDGDVLKSVDGGYNWTKLSNSPNDALSGIKAVSEDTLVLVSFTGNVYRSTDGGQTWSDPLAVTQNSVWNMEFYDNMFGVLVGSNGSVAVTRDGGLSWQDKNVDPSAGLKGLSIINENSVIVVGNDGVIFKTENGGENWDELTSPTYLDLSDALFFNADSGIVIGSHGVVFKTEDGGKSWEYQTSKAQTLLIGIDKFDNMKMIAVGGYGIIIYTHNGGDFQYGPIWENFLNNIKNASEAEQGTLVEQFMISNSTFPLVEQDSLVYFVYRTSSTTVELVGDMNSWNAQPMQRLASTNLWYSCRDFEMDARMEYKFLVNGIFQVDPLNPNKSQNSYLFMLGYQTPPEISYFRDIPHGSITDTTIHSNILRNNRPLKIYLPPGYHQSTQTYPLAVFHDGSGFILYGKAKNVLDYLIYQNRIQPIIGIFVDPVDRDNEYAFDKTAQFIKFITTELLPYIDSKYRTNPSPSLRATIGVSYGGTISTQLAFEQPDQFGLAGCFSPAYGPKNQAVLNMIKQNPKKEIRYYIDWGSYEHGIRRLSLEMRNNLIGKEYDIKWKEWHEGHDWTNWGTHLKEALEFFFAPGTTVNVANRTEIPLQFNLYQNYPNPFNPKTTISYFIPQSGFVELKIYNMLGSEVQTAVNEFQQAGEYSFDFDASKLSNGVYFYQLKIRNRFSETKKMLYIK